MVQPERILSNMRFCFYRVKWCCSLVFCLLLGTYNTVWSASTLDSNALSNSAAVDECVIVLHGLARTAKSMVKMAAALSESGYIVANVDYPSREKTVQELASPAIQSGLKQCEKQGATTMHFVTHSMGGILVRQYLSEHTLENLGRVIMLAPPNQGSEVVDKLGDMPGYELLNGPAGLQLGTDVDSVPLLLGPVDFDLGIIAGTRSVNLVLSTLLPNQDDGKVSIARAQIEGMCDFLVLEVTHTFIMKNDEVINQVLHYLGHGYFSRTNQTNIQALQLPAMVPPSHCQ